ncbi:2-keto-4-pentenoate hydratase [Microbacterium sp. YY-01]|uniref:2-keto-4-pentenoate hydratase n=1 Tax=Microbacterium sp. YY-01 TaxID=3421634 RepID=UPI003D178BDC
MKTHDPAITEAVERLRTAARTATPCAPVRDIITTLDDAYAVQSHIVGAEIDSGRRIGGRKIGLTSTAVQQQLGVDRPDFGALYADEIFMSGHRVDLACFIAPRVEAEIAFVLDRDLDMTHPSAADVQAAIGLVAPAIEIVDSRIIDWDITLIDTVADNASGAASVIGQARSFASLDLDLRDVGMVMERGTQAVSVGAGAACLGHPLVAVTWLAQELARRGNPLRAGDLIMSGALGPMASVTSAGAYEARIEGLGSVRVEFTAAHNEQKSSS